MTAVVKTPADLLVATRDLLMKNGWAPRDHRCVLYTVERAFDKAQVPADRWRVIAVPALSALAATAGHPSVVAWNYDPATTQADVLRVIDETVDKLRARLQLVR